MAVIETLARDGETFLREHLTPEVLADSIATTQAVLPPFLRTFATQPRLTRLMLQEFSVISPRHGWVVANFGLSVWHLLDPLFAGLAKHGRLAGARPKIAYSSLIGVALITFGNPDLVMRL